MNQIATITGKRQLTIPIEIYQKAGFSNGQKVIVSFDDRGLRVESATDLVDRLAGSLPVPHIVQTADIDTVIIKAKQAYMHKRMRQKQI